MKKINFKNNGQPAINDTNLNLMQDNIENELNAKVNTSDLIDLIYPVGSIYMSANNVSPANLFGGTWEQIKDRFLLACGSTYNAGATGGEATHKLTIDEMPKHSHKTWLGTTGGAEETLSTGDRTEHNWGATSALEATGGGQPHNNMPPYLAVYMWKRTA